MRRSLWFVLAVAVMSVGACSSGPGGTRESRKLIETDVNVLGWNDARVGATLIDRDGRRTGWNVDRPINQIAGCVYEAGSEEEDKENLNEASSDTPRGPRPTPMEHHFTLANDLATPAGLI